MNLKLLKIWWKNKAEFLKNSKQYEYAVALDYVDNLGYFIEIEVKKYDDDAIKEYDNLIKIAKDLNLNNIDKIEYPYYIIIRISLI